MVFSMGEPARKFDSMSIDEQIRYVQRLWDQIAVRAEAVRAPEEHLAEVRTRRAEPRDTVPWDEAMLDAILPKAGAEQQG